MLNLVNTYYIARVICIDKDNVLFDRDMKGDDLFMLMGKIV